MNQKANKVVESCISMEYCIVCTWEILYADDLVIEADWLELFKICFQYWK